VVLVLQVPQKVLCVPQKVLQVLQKVHHISETNKQGTDEKKDGEGIQHPGIVCDGCEGPVCGNRFKCVIPNKVEFNKYYIILFQGNPIMKSQLYFQKANFPLSFKIRPQ
jgi:hypothetical protein